MSTGWPKDQQLTGSPSDDEDPWPTGDGGGRGNHPSGPLPVDQSSGGNSSGGQPSDGKSSGGKSSGGKSSREQSAGGKSSRRGRRGQAGERDRESGAGAANDDDDYEWIRYLTGGRPSSSGAPSAGGLSSGGRSSGGADARDLQYPDARQYPDGGQFQYGDPRLARGADRNFGVPGGPQPAPGHAPGHSGPYGTSGFAPGSAPGLGDRFDRDADEQTDPRLARVDREGSPASWSRERPGDSGYAVPGRAGDSFPGADRRQDDGVRRGNSGFAPDTDLGMARRPGSEHATGAGWSERDGGVATDGGPDTGWGAGAARDGPGPRGRRQEPESGPDQGRRGRSGQRRRRGSNRDEDAAASKEAPPVTASARKAAAKKAAAQKAAAEKAEKAEKAQKAATEKAAANKAAANKAASEKAAAKKASSEKAPSEAADAASAGLAAARLDTAGEATAGRATGGRATGGRAERRAGRRKSRRLGLIAAGAVGVVAAAGAAYELMPSGGGPVHVIATPHQIGSYVVAPALAESMSASKLRNTMVSESSGEASHVVATVYEDTAGVAARNGPQIVLFIGGNLSGSSANSFIRSFIGKLPGAVTTAAGPLGGAAACVPSAPGGLAECAWADNDTFGLVTSPTLSVEALANELRQIRPAVEHRAK